MFWRTGKEPRLVSTPSATGITTIMDMITTTTMTMRTPMSANMPGQIARQLQASGGQVTTGQIALFGITGGLIPCPASITVLLICLQLGQFTLGVATVAAFSIGLALTMVLIGVAAAWGVHHASKRINFSERLLRRLPLASAGLVAVLGLIMLVQGAIDLASPATILS